MSVESEIRAISPSMYLVANYIEMLGKALLGDLVLSISPETVSSSPTSSAWTRTVTVSLVDSEGNIHTWYNDSITVSIADTSAAGTASIAETTVTMTNGVAEITISGDAADWLDTETDTLTIDNLTILSNTVTGGTSVETFSA